MPKYIAIPAAHCANYRDILDYAAARYDVAGNDFCGSRQYNASTGVIVFKLDV